MLCAPAPQANDAQTALLLGLLRGNQSRKWLRDWLSQEGRADQVRAAIAKAPEQLQQVLTGVLMRRLGADEDEDDVRIMLLGGHALIDQAASTKGGNNDNKPLPRPLARGGGGPMRLYSHAAGSPPRIEVGRRRSRAHAHAAPPLP